MTIIVPKYPIIAAHGLLTVEILYPIPDFRGIFQLFIHQFDDVSPQFPRFERFIEHWRTKIEVQPRMVRYFFQPEGGTYLRVGFDITYN